MEICVLGPVEARTPTGGVIRFSGRRAAVLELLALRRGRLVSKRLLLEVIWDDTEKTNALEAIIGRIRSDLGLRRDNDVLITEKASGYRLRADTDISAFEHLARGANELRSQGKARHAIQAYDSALQLWRDEAFPELAESPLVSVEVRRLQRTRWEVQLRLLELQVSEGHWQDALVSADKMLGEDPYSEPAYIYQAQALQHFRGVPAAASVLRDAVQTFLDAGLEPSSNLLRLQQQILRSTRGSEDTRDSETPAALTDTSSAPSYTSMLSTSEETTGGSIDGGIFHNLPAPTYMTFVPRDALWQKLSHGFEETGLPIIAMVGLGGNGKSVLAREYATYLARQSPVDFRLIVWISDREVPGSTTLNAVLDEIAAAADYSGLASRPLAEKKLLTIRIMQRTKTLLIIDNFETIVNKELGQWLATVPPPNKVLITSIVRPRNLDSYCYEIDVGGLTEKERDLFYNQLLARRNLLDLAERRSELADLWSAANGNPKLIEWALGQVKTRGRSVRDIAQDISASRDQAGGSSQASTIILNELFRDSWKAMTPSTKDVLMALSCFPYGAIIDVIRRVSGTGANLEDALEQLQDLCFVSRRPGPAGGDSWYMADPLATTQSEIQHGPNTESIQDRWLEYSIELAESIGFCPEDVSRLERLDPAEVRENLEYAITWAFDNARYDATIRMTRGVRYYYYVRGLWSADPNVHLVRVQAAQRSKNVAEEFDSLLYFVNIAAKQENRPVILEYLPRIEVIVTNHSGMLSPGKLAEYHHVRALCLLAQSEYDQAAAEWELNLADPDVLRPADYSANLRWYAICLARNGDISASTEVFKKARMHAQEHHYDRAVFFIDMELASIKLDNTSRLDPAAKRDVVTEVLDYLRDAATMTAVSSLNDRRYTADYEWLLARVNYLAGQTSEGREHAARAAELYDRLGLTERAYHARARGRRNETTS